MSTLAQAHGVSIHTGDRYRRSSIVKMRAHYAQCSKIIGYVADRYKVPVSLIRRGGNQREFVVPRHMAMFLCQEFLGMSLPAIGQAFGGYDHSTVHHAVHKVRGMQDVPEIAAFLDEAREALKYLPRPSSVLYAPPQEAER